MQHSQNTVNWLQLPVRLLQQPLCHWWEYHRPRRGHLLHRTSAHTTQHAASWTTLIPGHHHHPCDHPRSSLAQETQPHSLMEWKGTAALVTLSVETPGPTSIHQLWKPGIHHTNIYPILLSWVCGSIRQGPSHRLNASQAPSLCYWPTPRNNPSMWPYLCYYSLNNGPCYSKAIFACLCHLLQLTFSLWRKNMWVSDNAVGFNQMTIKYPYP